MAESPDDLRSRRVLIWGGLLVLLVAAVILLVVAMSKDKAPTPTPTPPPDESPGELRRPVVVQVVDARDEPIQHARVFVFQDVDAPSGEAGTWNPDTASLSLPFTGEPRTLVAQARGYRTQQIEDVVGDRTIRLEPGYLARVVITGDAALPAPPIAIYVRLNPEPHEGGILSREESDTILDLMGVVQPAEGAVPEAPRAGFGLLLPAARAAAGVRMPLAGRYVVKWGFMDEKAGTWYGLSEHIIEVKEDSPSTRFEIPLTDEAVAATLAKLREEIAKMNAARSGSGAPKDD